MRELFALGKYGCCCCLEELSWITALLLLDNISEEDVLPRASTFQAWGGIDGKCSSSMKNALLSEDPRRSFRLEDASLNVDEAGVTLRDGICFMGNETWSLLEQARSQGILFARKFNSSAESAALLDTIQQSWHHD